MTDFLHGQQRKPRGSHCLESEGRCDDLHSRESLAT